MKRIVFNTTYHINCSCVQRWLDFVKQHLMPRIEQNSLFSDFRICKVFVGDSPNDEVFSVQFCSESRKTIEMWNESEGRLINTYMRKTFGEKVLSFSIFMEEIEL